jgi:hypothetical protein
MLSATDIIAGNEPLEREDQRTSSDLEAILPPETQGAAPQNTTLGSTVTQSSLNETTPPVVGKSTKLFSWRSILGLHSLKETTRDYPTRSWSSPTSPDSSGQPESERSTTAQSPSSLSLESNRPSLASSLVFSLSSLTSSRTSVDSDSLVLPTSSPNIYRWCKDEPIYIGRLKELPAQITMEKEWRTTMKPRVYGDLRLVLHALPRSLAQEKTIVEAELCLVGEANTKAAVVELRPKMSEGRRNCCQRSGLLANFHQL